MSATRITLLSTLENTEQRLAALTGPLDEQALDFHTAPDEWSIREILAHLVDDEMFIMRTRLERMIKEDKPAFLSHDEKAWYRQRNTTRDSLAELLADFSIQRQASLRILSFLRESEWARQAFHPEYGTFTAEQWVANWVEHDLTHIRQIEEIIATLSRN